MHTVPPTSNSVHGREKNPKYNNFSVAIIQWLGGAVVKDPVSLSEHLEGTSSNAGQVRHTFFLVF